MMAVSTERTRAAPPGFHRRLAATLAIGALCSTFEAFASGPPAVTRVDPPAAAGASSPNLVEARGAVLATWLEPGKAMGGITLRFSRFDGARWSMPVTIFESNRVVANWADVPSVVAGEGASLLAHWAVKNGEAAHAYDVRLARSDDGGKSWKQLGSPHADRTQSEHGFVTLSAEGPVFRATWIDGRNTLPPGSGPSALRTAVVGAASEPDVEADERVCDCCGTASATVDGGTLVVYRNRDDQETRDIWAVRLSATGRGKPHPVHVDGWKIAGCPVNGPAVAASGRDAVVAWYTYAGSEPSIRVSFSANGGDSFTPPVTVAAASGKAAPIGRVDVALLAPSEAAVSWVTSSREDAVLQLARVTRDARLGAPLAVTTTRSDRQAGFPKLAVLGDRLMVIWTDAGPPSTLRAVVFDASSLPRAQKTPASRSAPASAQRPLTLPTFGAARLDGGTASSTELAGRWTLVNVWATWCEPCRMELPALNRIAQAYGARGLSVVGLSVDREKTDAEIEAFARHRGVSFPIWRDREERAATLLGVTVLPKTLLIDPAGKVVWSRDGAVGEREPELEKLLDGIAQGGPKK